MMIAADEFLVELERTETMMQEVVRCAGQGCSHEFERRFEAQLRRLRSMLGTDGSQAAVDVMDAAERVLISADPAAPLLMLSLSRKTLAALMRRQANSVRLHAA